MDAAIYGRRTRIGRQFVTVLVLVAACYALGGATGFALRSISWAGSAGNGHAMAPAVSRFDVTLKAGERQALQQNPYGPWSDLTRALPKSGQEISTSNTVVSHMDDRAPGFVELTPGVSAAAAGGSVGVKFHEPGSRLGGNRI